jgi:hypothetical protein
MSASGQMERNQSLANRQRRANGTTTICETLPVLSCRSSAIQQHREFSANGDLQLSIRSSFLSSLLPRPTPASYNREPSPFQSMSPPVDEMGQYHVLAECRSPLPFQRLPNCLHLKTQINALLVVKLQAQVKPNIRQMDCLSSDPRPRPPPPRLHHT